MTPEPATAGQSCAHGTKQGLAAPSDATQWGQNPRDPHQGCQESWPSPSAFQPGKHLIQSSSDSQEFQIIY